MIVNCLNDKPLPVYGKGLNVRDWLYTEDHCRAIDLIIHNGRTGEVYNIGSHNEMRNTDIVKLICRALGKPKNLITYVANRNGHDLRYAIDPSKIHQELGWLPTTTFETGIRRTINWYLTHRGWWVEIISGKYRNYYEKRKCPDSVMLLYQFIGFFFFNNLRFSSLQFSLIFLILNKNFIS